MGKHLKFRETSKLLLVIEELENFIFTVACFWLAWVKSDLTVLWYLIPQVLGSSLYRGFYVWKAKSENRIKYTQRHIKDMADEYGIDNAIRLAESYRLGDMINKD